MLYMSIELCALLLVVLCVALGFRSLLLSLRPNAFGPPLLSTLFKSLDLVRLMSPSKALNCFLGNRGPDSISICQLGFTDPGAACDG